MPTYEYICAACEHEWEVEQSIKDDPLKKCPSCRKLKAKRQISRGGGFILKGGGWYSDLYASAPAPTAAAGESGASSEASSDGADAKATTTDAGTAATADAPKAESTAKKGADAKKATKKSPGGKKGGGGGTGGTTEAA